MRRLFLLAVLCLVGALAFAPAALTQDFSVSASASADPCPDPNFPRETPDGCQASDLPDVTPGATASASASASAAAHVGTEPISVAPGGPCVTPELAPDVVGVPIEELPNAYLNRNDPVGTPISSPLDPDGNGIACDGGSSSATADADEVSVSATAEGDDESSASASASAESVEDLPDTGGVSPALLTVLPALLLVGSGVLAVRVVRRT